MDGKWPPPCALIWQDRDCSACLRSDRKSFNSASFKITTLWRRCGAAQNRKLTWIETSHPFRRKKRKGWGRSICAEIGKLLRRNHGWLNCCRGRRRLSGSLFRRRGFISWFDGGLDRRDDRWWCACGRRCHGGSRDEWAVERLRCAHGSGARKSALRGYVRRNRNCPGWLNGLHARVHTPAAADDHSENRRRGRAARQRTPNPGIVQPERRGPRKNPRSARRRAQAGPKTNLDPLLKPFGRGKAGEQPQRSFKLGGTGGGKLAGTGIAGNRVLS